MPSVSDRRRCVAMPANPLYRQSTESHRAAAWGTEFSCRRACLEPVSQIRPTVDYFERSLEYLGSTHTTGFQISEQFLLRRAQAETGKDNHEARPKSHRRRAPI